MKGLNRQSYDNTIKPEKQEVFAARNSNKGRRREAVPSKRGRQLCREAVSYIQGVIDAVEQAI